MSKHLIFKYVKCCKVVEIRDENSTLRVVDESESERVLSTLLSKMDTKERTLAFLKVQTNPH